MASPSDGPLKRFIREIHRRSLWQVLGIYLVASWAVLQVVDTLGGALNLPDGFDSFALALLILGLPIVLASAFIAGGAARDTSHVADVPADPPRSLRRVVPTGSSRKRPLSCRTAPTRTSAGSAVWNVRSICRALMLCFGAAGGVPALAASQETDIDVVVLRAFSALSEGDVDAYLSQVRPGARVIVHYSGTLELHVDEWRESLRDVTWEPGQISSRVFGNTAVTVAQLDGTLRMPGGDALDGPWRFAETRIRDQGTWRIVQLELSAVDPAADSVVEVGARRPAADAGETGRIAGVTSGRAAASSRQITDPPAPVGGAMINQAGQDGATLRAVRVNEPLEIDGVIEEPFYQSVPPITEFVQVVPEEDGEPSELTEVWIGFDDNNVYVTAKIWYAAGSDGWIANEMRRDSRRLASNDHFGVWFDTYYDRRNAVGFYGNAIGGLNDMQITNEGSPNFDWNPLREIRTALFDGGWSIEMAIPFKSLRYRPGREQIWGIQMRRFIGRRNEWEYIRAVPFSVASDGWQGIFRVSMYGTLMGIEAPPPSRNLEVKPYVISGLETNLVATPQIDRDGYADAGLDIKYGITENLTADLTFNTDFAQVEVDEQQVNLTRFSLFFPEKREFFLEGRGIFNFGSGGIGGGGGGFGGGGAPTLFYSRQIGLEGGQAVPILGGGRVTGKVGSFDLGLISIQTNDSRPFDLGSLSRDREVQAESTNFSVFRLRRDIFSRSSIGVLFENRDKAVASTGSNQAWGVDGSFGLSDELSLLAYYAQTRTEGLEGLDVSYPRSAQLRRGRVGGQHQPPPGRCGLQSRDRLRAQEGLPPDVGNRALRPPPRVRPVDSAAHLPGGGKLSGERAARVRREQELGRPVRGRARERRPAQCQLRERLRGIPAAGAHLGRARPCRAVRQPGGARQLLGRPSAPRVGQRVLPQGGLLRRHSHGRGSESLAYRGHAAALGRAQRLLQLDRPPAGEARSARRGDPRDLHAHPARAPERARAVQLRQRHVQRQLPLPLGVGSRERALRRVHGGSRHGRVGSLVAAPEPRLRDQDQSSAQDLVRSSGSRVEAPVDRGWNRLHRAFTNASLVAMEWLLSSSTAIAAVRVSCPESCSSASELCADGSGSRIARR